MHSCGIYWLFGNIPMWALAVGLYFLVIGVLFVIRDLQYGIPYNISVSSQQGDLALIGCILIGAQLVKSGFLIPVWLLHERTGIVLVGVFTGVLWQFLADFSNNPPDSAWESLADVYHNLVVVPILLSSLLALLPMTFVHGTFSQKAWTLAFLALWAMTVAFDARHGRLRQQSWLKKHGATPS